MMTRVDPRAPLLRVSADTQHGYDAHGRAGWITAWFLGPFSALTFRPEPSRRLSRAEAERMIEVDA